jgi:hypothetical protein
MDGMIWPGLRETADYIKPPPHSVPILRGSADAGLLLLRCFCVTALHVLVILVIHWRAMAGRLDRLNASDSLTT